MATNRPPLRYDILSQAPEKSFIAPPPRLGDPPAWDPTTATLIFGERDAVLVDALMTFREATALADWVGLHERQLTTIYITHGHADHYLGLSVLLSRFPNARAVASTGTVALMRTLSAPQVLNNDRVRFPGQIADKIALPEPLDADHFELEGHRLPGDRNRTHRHRGHYLVVRARTWAGRLRRRRLQSLPHVRRRHNCRQPGPNGSLPLTGWRRCTRLPSSPVTRIRPAAIPPRSWPSPAATWNTTDSSAGDPCLIRSCSTRW